MKTSIAVLGCGYWGANHIKTLHALGYLAAVSDINTEKAQILAANYDVPFLTPEALVRDDSIMAIVLALPPQFHAPNAIKAMQHGKDVLIEKPISLDLNSAKQVLEVARETQRVLQVGHILRFHSAFEKLLELTNSETLGHLRYIDTKRYGFGKFHTSSDALWDLAPHDLSMILALAGSAPCHIHASNIAMITDGADFSSLQLSFTNKLTANLAVSRLSAYRERRVTVVGTKAIAVFDDLEPWERKLALYAYNIEKTGMCWPGSCSEASYIPLVETMPLEQELKHFVHCIVNRLMPRTSGEEAVQILHILEQATLPRVA